MSASTLRPDRLSENHHTDPANYPRAFTQLLKAIGELIHVPAPAVIDGPVRISVDDVVFRLSCEQNTEPHLLRLECEFGQADAGREADVYRALLEINLLLYPEGGPTFALSRESGYVTLVTHYPLATLVPQGLQRALVNLAAQAQSWRRHQFLSLADEKPRHVMSHRRFQPNAIQKFNRATRDHNPDK